MIATRTQGVILILAALMPTMAVVSLIPVLPQMLREFATTPGVQLLGPLVVTGPAIAVSLLSPLAGWLSDRVGRKRLLVGALLLYGAIGVLPLALDDLRMIVVARLTLGVVEAVIMTVSTALLGDYFENEERERWVGLQIAAVSFSAIVLIALGGAMGQLFGYRGPFALYSLAVPIGVVAATWLFEPARTRKSRAGVRPNVRHRNLRAMLPLVAMTFGVSLLFYTIVIEIGPILEEAGVTSSARIGLAGAAANGGIVIGSFLFRRSAKWVGRRLLAIGLALACVGYIGAAWSDDFYLLTGFAVLASVGSGILLPNMLMWTFRNLPLEVRGVGTGVWTSTFFLGQFASPLIFVAISHAFAISRTTLLVYAGCAGCGALLAALGGGGNARAPGLDGCSARP